MKMANHWFAIGQRLIVGGGLLLHTPPMRAQVTYNVFPANPGSATAEQPTPTVAHVTLVLRDSTLEYVVRALAHQANVRLVYDNTNPLFAKAVSVHVTDLPIMKALTNVLQGTGLKAQVAPGGEMIVIRPGSVAAKAVGGEVTGRITDSASGAGLAGATVHVAGTKLSALSSDSGHFTLKGVPGGDQLLTVKLFGYRPAERSITVVDSERTTVHIVMIPVPTVLSGVVTTVAGTQRKVEVGNDITTLNVDSVMRVAPVTSVTDLLEGRVPGLTAVHSSGVPGAPSRLRLRGASSITGDNDPVVIVDGVRVYASQSDPRNANLAPNVAVRSANHGQKVEPVTNVGGDASSSGFSSPSPLDQIDPNSIETIEVLKGPSATAIYGSDAANGVVVITTKHGRAGPTRWTATVGSGLNWLPGQWPANYYRFGKTSDPYGIPLNGISTDSTSHPCAWYDLHCTTDSLVSFQALNDPRYSIFSHGSDQTASLTISGGVPSMQYSVTGTGAGDVGNLKLPAIEQQRYDHFYGPIPHALVRPDNYTTWGIDGTVTAVPSPALRVTVQSSLFNSNQQQGSLQGAISQLEGVYINNGTVLSNMPSSESPGLHQDSLSSTPLILNDVERATDAQVTSKSTATVAWQARSWLPLTFIGGLQTMQRTDVTYVPFGVNNSGPGTPLFDTTGAYGLGRGSSRSQQLSATTTIPALSWLSLSLGGEAYSQSTNDFTALSNQLAPGVSVPTSFVFCSDTGNVGVGTRGIACTNGPSTQASTSTSTYGIYLQTQIHLFGNTYLNPGFRLDGGNGEANTTNGGIGGLTAFPKIDLSYVAVDDHRPLGPLTLLRPRLAFGVAGTQPTPEQKLRLFSNDSLVQLSSGTYPGVQLSTVGNTQLRPETSHEIETGLDAALWHGRLSATVSFYNRTLQNALIQVPVAPSVSPYVLSQWVNLGEVRNTGTELTGHVQLLQRRAVSLFLDAMISQNANKVVKLATGFAPNKVIGIVPGYPLFGDWALPIVGFADLNHNGIIEPNEVQTGDSLRYVGQSNPKYVASFSPGMILFNGRLAVNASFEFNNGMTQDNAAALSSGAVNSLGNTPGTSLATEAAIVAAEADLTKIGFYQTVNTFSFASLSVSYSVPRAVSQWFHVPAASVSLQGSNLALHTNYRGIDPNVNAFSTVSAGDETADLGQIPTPRTWWLKFMLGN